MQTRKKHLASILTTVSAITMFSAVSTQIADAAVITNAVNSNSVLTDGGGVSLINTNTRFPTNFNNNDSFYFSSNNGLSTGGAVTIASIDVAGFTAGPFIINNNTTLGSVGNSVLNDLNKLAITITNTQSLELSGTQGTGKNSAIIGPNIYTGLGDITLENDSTLSGVAGTTLTSNILVQGVMANPSVIQDIIASNLNIAADGYAQIDGSSSFDTIIFNNAASRVKIADAQTLEFTGINENYNIDAEKIIFDGADSTLKLSSTLAANVFATLTSDLSPGLNAQGIIELHTDNDNSTLDITGAFTLGGGNTLKEIKITGDGISVLRSAINTPLLNIEDGALLSSSDATTTSPAAINIGIGSELSFVPTDPNVNINPTSATQIVFSDNSSLLTLVAQKNDQRIFTLQNNIDPGGNDHGIIKLFSDSDGALNANAMVTLTANGNKTLGTPANKIAQLIATGDRASIITELVDISNVNELLVEAGAKPTIKTITLAAVPVIKIGEVDGESKLTFDTTSNDINLLNGQTISFDNAGSFLVLTNSGANNRIITLSSPLPPGGGNDLQGNLEINSNGTNSISVLGAAIGQDYLHRLNQLIISGNQPAIISSPIFAQNIFITNTNQITLNAQVESNNVIFDNDATVTVKSNLFVGSFLTENNNQGTININSLDIAIGGIGDQNDYIKNVNFEQSASVGNTFATNISVLGGETATFNAQAKFTEMQLFNGGVANFRGNVSAGSIVSSDLFNNFGEINFIGNNQIQLNNNIRVETINFEESNITVENNDIGLEGAAVFDNVTINLGNNNLILESPVNFAGNNTINTTVIDNAGDAGSLVASPGSNLTTDAGSNVRIVVDNTAVGPINGQKITVIKANGGNMTNFDIAKVIAVASNPMSLWTATKDINGNIILTNQSQVANVLIHDRVDKAISPDILSDDFAEMLQDAEPGTEAFGYEKELANMDEQTQIASAERIENTVPTSQISTTTLSSVVHNISSRINVFTSRGAVSSFTAPSINTNNVREVTDSNIVTGIAAGEDEARYGAWISPIYSNSIQKTTGSAAGYRAQSLGGTIGLDGKVRDDVVIGAAFSYVNTNAKFKDYKSGDKTKMQSLLFSLYGIKQLSNNFFAQSVITVARTKVHSRENRITDNGTQTAKSNYSSNSFGAQILGGYNYFIKDKYIITPMAGIDYQQINGTSYRETGTTNQNLTIKREALDEIDLLAGLRISSGSFMFKNMDVTPEIHGFLRYDLTNKAAKIVSSLDSGTGQTFVKSSKTTRTYGNIGFGINARHGIIDYGIGYDVNLAKKFIGQQGSLKIRVDF